MTTLMPTSLDLWTCESNSPPWARFWTMTNIPPSYWVPSLTLTTTSLEVSMQLPTVLATPSTRTKLSVSSLTNMTDVCSRRARTALMQPLPRTTRSNAISVTLNASIATISVTTNPIAGPRGEVKKVSVPLGVTIAITAATTAVTATATTE